MRVVFLDIDGVLNNSTTKANWPPPDGCLVGFDTLNVSAFNSFMTQAETLFGRMPHIVVSSAWRCGRDLPMMAKILREACVLGEVFSMTPPPKFSGTRAMEIKEWLNNFKPTNLEGYVALDDICLPPVFDRAVHVDSKTGFTTKNIDKALKLLSLSTRRK